MKEEIIIKMENTDKIRDQPQASISSLDPKAKPDSSKSIISKVTNENPIKLQKARSKTSDLQNILNRTLILEQEKAYMGQDDNKKLSLYRPKIPFFKEKLSYPELESIKPAPNMTRSKTTPNPEFHEKLKVLSKRTHENELKDYITLPKVDLSKEEKHTEKTGGWKKVKEIGEKLKIGSNVRDRDTHYYEFSPSTLMPGSDGFTS